MVRVRRAAPGGLLGLQVRWREGHAGPLAAGGAGGGLRDAREHGVGGGLARVVDVSRHPATLGGVCCDDPGPGLLPLLLPGPGQVHPAAQAGPQSHRARHGARAGGDVAHEPLLRRPEGGSLRQPEGHGPDDGRRGAQRHLESDRPDVHPGTAIDDEGLAGPVTGVDADRHVLGPRPLGDHLGDTLQGSLGIEPTLQLGGEPLDDTPGVDSRASRHQGLGRRSCRPRHRVPRPACRTPHPRRLAR